MCILSRTIDAVNILKSDLRIEALQHALTAYTPDRKYPFSVITHDELREMLEAGQLNGGRHEPLGVFIVPEQDGTMTAIDNRYGEAYTENFDRLSIALLWLMNDEMTATEARAAWEKLQKESLSL